MSTKTTGGGVANAAAQIATKNEGKALTDNFIAAVRELGQQMDALPGRVSEAVSKAKAATVATGAPDTPAPAGDSEILVKQADRLSEALAEAKRFLAERDAAGKGSDELAAKLAAFQGSVDELRARVDSVAAGHAFDARESGIAGVNDNRFGGLDVAIKAIMASGSYQEFMAAKARNPLAKAPPMPGRGQPGVAEIPSLTHPDASWAAAELAAKSTPAALAEAEFGSMTPERIRFDPVEQLRHAIGLLGRIPRVGLDGADRYRFAREVPGSEEATTHGRATVAVTSGTTMDLVLDSVTGFRSGQPVYHLSAAGVRTLVGTIDTINTGTLTITFLANIPVNIAIGEVAYQQYGVPGTAESATKPPSYLRFEEGVVDMVAVALTMFITRQRLVGPRNMRSFLQRRLRDKAVRLMEWHALYGSGSGGDLHGFLTYTGRQTYAWSSGAAGDTMADAVRRAATLIPGNGLKTATLHRTDWDTIVLHKSATDGHYVQGEGRGPRIIDEPMRKAIGSVEVVISDAVVLGDFLVADHSAASEWADAERSEFAMGLINDQFVTNEETARYEEYVNHAIALTSAFVDGDFDAAP